MSIKWGFLWLKNYMVLIYCVVCFFLLRNDVFSYDIDFIFLNGFGGFPCFLMYDIGENISFLEGEVQTLWTTF